MNTKQFKTMVQTISEVNANKEFRNRESYTNPVVIAWGPQGVGKSFTIKEAGTNIGQPVLNVRLSQELAEDMSYPKIEDDELKKVYAEMWPRYKTDEEGNKINRRKVVNGEIIEIEDEYQINLSSLDNYIENYDELKVFYENQGLTIDDAPGVILFLDEINRIEDKQLFQMIFQLLESGRFKGFVFPEEVTVFGACNPDKGYIVAPWFEDKAFASRCIHIKLQFDKDIAISNLKSAGYDEVTLEMLSTYPEMLFDQEANNFDTPVLDYSMRNASFFDNYVVNVDWEKTEHPEVRDELVSAIYGEEFIGPFYTILEKTAKKAFEAEAILTEYDDYELGENPFNIHNENGIDIYVADTVLDHIENQNSESTIRKKFLAELADGKSDFIDRVIDNMRDYIHDNIDDPEFTKMFDQNKLKFLRFVLDLPRGKYGNFFRSLINSKSNDQDVIRKSELFLNLIISGENKIASKAITEIIQHLNKKITESVK